MTVRRERRTSSSQRPTEATTSVTIISAMVAIALSVTSLPLAARAPSPTAAVVAGVPSSLPSARPYWVELTGPQRDALMPLADDWERLDLQTKKKWVEIADRYPRMQPDEQARSRQRMREYARLTPEQRRTARDTFTRVRAMNADQRADLLRKYQELPPERKQALTTEGQANRMIVVPRPLPSLPAPKRSELSEGARVRPAVAAQKSANPIVAPAKRVEVPAPAPVVATPVPTEPVPAPSAGPHAAGVAASTSGPAAPTAAP